MALQNGIRKTLQLLFVIEWNGRREGMRERERKRKRVGKGKQNEWLETREQYKEYKQIMWQHPYALKWWYSFNK